MNAFNATTSGASPERAGWTIEEWCSRYGFKRGLYYKMDDRPEAIRIGSKVIITIEADQEWRQRQRDKVKASA
jgi:hypothetical protein